MGDIGVTRGKYVLAASDPRRSPRINEGVRGANAGSPRSGAMMGAGSHLSPIQRHAFSYYVFTAGCSVREACRLACIAKGTGLKLHAALRKIIARERRAA